MYPLLNVQHCRETSLTRANMKVQLINHAETNFFSCSQLQHSMFHLTSFISVIDLHHKAHYCRDWEDKYSTFHLLHNVCSEPQEDRKTLLLWFRFLVLHVAHFENNLSSISDSFFIKLSTIYIFHWKKKNPLVLSLQLYSFCSWCSWWNLNNIQRKTKD